MATTTTTSFEKKLIAARAELVTTTGHWRKEWREAILQWSDKITIVGISDLDQMVVLPTDSGGSYYFLVTRQDTMVRSLGDAVHYRLSTANNYLSAVPVNLASLVYRNFVVALGGKFSNRIDHKIMCEFNIHYLWTDDNYKRHRKLIHSLTPQLFSDFDNLNRFDGWEAVVIMGIRAEDKFKPSNYIGAVLAKLNTYQLDKMLSHYFQFQFHPRSDKTSEMVQSAKSIAVRMVVSINLSDGFRVSIFGGNFYFILFEGNGRESTMDSSSLDGGNNWQLWQLAMANPDFVKMLGNLSEMDVRFIISCLVDIEYDKLETMATIKKLEETGSNFPGPDDDFNSFDYPLLRGPLAETVVSKKLQGCALSMEEITKGQFADIAPAALVNIVGSYYPIDLLHG